MKLNNKLIVLYLSLAITCLVLLYTNSEADNRQRVLRENNDDDDDGNDSNDVEEEENNEDNNLRFVTFGTSVTWGAMMEHPWRAYPYLLSKTVENKAMRASDSSYPSMCTQTMIGDAIYDVIIIEYDRRRFECLEVLVRRLRQRFPDAMIILIKVWNLMEVEVIDSQGKKFKLREKLLESEAERMVSEESLEYVINSDDEIRFVSRLDPRDDIFDKIASENNATIYEWSHVGNIVDLLRFRHHFFVDLVHFNDYGHRIVANDIKRLLAKHKPKRSDRVGDWGEGDYCSSWFQTGEHDVDRNGRQTIRSPATPMKKFDEKNGKYALEINERTALAIDNPFDGDRKLYLTYMSSYPNKLYPQVSIFIAGQHEETTVIITPEAPYDFPVHVQDTRYVGMLKPGTNVVKITALEEAEMPFRLVGFAITNGMFKPSDMFFKPEGLDVKSNNHYD